MVNDVENQENISKALSLYHYTPISLSGMEHIALLNRTETKYVLPVTTLKQIMPALASAYSVLVVNRQRCSQYQTLYFDTTSFSLYHQHHAGILNRYKVRSRKYVNSQLAFLEVKHRTNKGRTIKNRVQTPDLIARLDGHTAEFLSYTYPYNTSALEPKLWVEYTRITLASRHHQERVTIDLNLSYKWQEQTINLPHLAIIEIKQEAFSRNSAIEQLLRQHHIRVAGGFSKYCIGISLIYPEIKHNNFKPKLKLVEKLAKGSACGCIL